MIVVLWGVSGCGKTTIGRFLAAQLACEFFDADDFHPPSNIEKMRKGVPLSDEDRWPWLDRIADILRATVVADRRAVLACSALRRAYRERIKVDDTQIRFIHLKGDFELIAARLASREHAFMNPKLLQSQFDTLETCAGDVSVDIAAEPDSVCQAISALLETA